MLSLPSFLFLRQTGAPAPDQPQRQAPRRPFEGLRGPGLARRPEGGRENGRGAAQGARRGAGQGGDQAAPGRRDDAEPVLPAVRSRVAEAVSFSFSF